VANTVTVKFKVLEDGTLKQISADAKKASKATDQATNSSDKYSKKLKGVAGMTSNSTKGFSKMTTGITGGLVPAYATLAANVFALSAAFNFLKRAADVSILEKSQVAYARNTGLALQSVTNGLREASDGMLGFQEAAEAAAIGVAKGFSPKQLEDLADGARRASAALGRGFEDSFDRLIRGASKAEPELLDELGITLRLKTATESYAKSLGVQADALTASQRSQAVLLETQKQLDELFGKGAVESNPFVVLSKTFEDLVRTGTDFFMPMIKGLVGIINASGFAAVAVFGALGLSIFKTMIPMGGLTKKIAEMGVESAHGTALAMQGQMDYADSVKESQAALDALNLSQSQKTASTAVDAGAGKSKLVTKLSKGDPLSAMEKGKVKKMLKEAEIQYQIHGEIVKGTFKGMDIAIVRDMKESMNDMTRSSAGFGKKMQHLWKKVKLGGKTAFSTIKQAGTSTLSGLGSLATKTGNLIGKAMKFAGIVGALVMVYEVARKIVESPYTLILGVAQAADKVIDFIFPMIKAPVVFIGKMIDWVGNKIKTLLNGYITMYNWLANSKLGDMLGISEVKLLNTESKVMEGIAKRVTSGNVGLAESYLNSAAAVRHLNQENKYTEKSNQEKSLKSMSASYEKMGEDINNAVKGMTSSMNNFSAAQKGNIQATSMGSIGLADRIKKIKETTKAMGADGEMLKHDTLTKGQQVIALAKLRKEMSKLTNISPQMAAALAESEPNVELIAKLEFHARNATTEFKAFNDAIQGVTSSMGEGNLEDTEYQLDALAASAESAINSFNLLGTPETHAQALKVQKDYDEALSGVGGTTKAYHKTLKQLRRDTEAHSISVQQANLLGGETAKVRKLENDVLSVGLELQKVEIQMLADLNDKTRDQLSLKRELLAVKAKEAEIALITKEQGAFMGSAAASGAIREGSAGVILEGAAGAERREGELSDNLGEQAKLTSDKTKVNKDNELPTEAEIEELNRKINVLKIAAEDLKSNIAIGKSATVGDKIGAIADYTSPMAAELAKLGPEGEYMSAAIMGAMSMGETFSNTFDKMTEKGASTSDKISAGLAGASAAVGALQSIMAAKSKAAVAGVDNEIAAEKARDGKSAASLAKIKALENKKEKMKKKAFEQNKKMQMAQIVMSTAVAIMSAIQGPPGLPWSAVFGGMAAAMGMAQLSAVASSSYQGGGSSSSAAMPSAVSVGSRSASVDLAKGNNASGEQAYARGASGTGTGMTNFKPTGAFSGHKGRASGGYIVGEQGPELFMPEIPGEIIPSGQETGGMTNVNFSISAVDAAGVEELLMNQRGNIIGMLREAANEHGEMFLESVQEKSY